MKNFLSRWLARDAAEPESPEADLAIYDPTQGISAVFVTTFGVASDLVPEIVEKTKEKLQKGGVRVVFITDDPDFAVFRRQGVAFEYFPSLIEQKLHATDIPWQPYLREKWGLLLAKWRPRQVLAYGTSIDNFLSAAPDAARPVA